MLVALPPSKLLVWSRFLAGRPVLPSEVGSLPVHAAGVSRPLDALLAGELGPMA